MTLSGRDEPLIGAYALLSRDSRGRWLVGTMHRSPGYVAVYDADGVPLQRFGRRGEGPGELISVHALAVTRGDTVHVFDNQLRRYSIFSPNYEFIRSAPMPGYVLSAVGLSDGSLIVNGDFPTPNMVGFPLHQLTRTGEVIRSFGVDVPSYRSDNPFLMNRLVAPVDNAGIWAVPSLRYEPALWSRTARLAVLERLVPWFPSQIRYQAPGRAERPSPGVMGVWHDGREHLWVMIRVPDANWRPPAVLPRGEQTAMIEWDREYDTIIEVLNTRTGRLIASQRFNEAFWQLITGGYATHYREDQVGEPYLDIWHLTTTTPTGR